MLVRLNNLDLVRLIISTCPSTYEAMDVYIESGLGRYIGGFNDTWEWNRTALYLLSEEELVELYFDVTGRNIRVKESEE